MAYLAQPYYVGLLSAASLHGSAHQQPQQFHVVTTTPQREVRKKGLAIRFFFQDQLQRNSCYSNQSSNGAYSRFFTGSHGH
ncbi:MAG TPA: hypothetical protein DCR81_02985 [Smithella sp.]|jgi:predicted transcriptional regulator of viral defense system|nr:hypothetical protein [Smithella sp.]